MVDRIELANEITEFLDRHSILAANYDPAYDEPEDRFNGPDSSMLFAASEALKADVEFTRPFSEFGSGCYKPISDKEVEAWHGRIMQKITEYLAEHYPASSRRR